MTRTAPDPSGSTRRERDSSLEATAASLKIAGGLGQARLNSSVRIMILTFVDVKQPMTTLSTVDPGADAELYEAIREQYPPVLTTAQVSELLHIGPRTVLVMAADGRLKASRLPGTRQYNFFREDVIRLLRENLVHPDDVDLTTEGAEPVKAPARKRPAGKAGGVKSTGARRRR